MKVPPVVHFLGQNAIRLVLLLVFVGIPAVALYVREVGIGFGAREALAAALSKESIGVSIGRLAFDPFSGLIAQDVVVREARPGGRQLAKLSDIALVLNLSDLAAGRITVDRLSLKRAAVSIPIGGAASSRSIDFEDVTAEVVLLGDRLRVSRFDGTFEHVRFLLTGQFLNPEKVKLPAAEHGGQAGRGDQLLDRVLGWLGDLRYGGDAPVLRADFEADLADPGSIRIPEWSFRARGISGKGWELREVEVSGAYADGLLTVPRVILRDGVGAVECSVEWNVKTGAMDSALMSTIDPGQFLRLFEGKNPGLKEVAFVGAPQIEARVVGAVTGSAPSVRVTGMAYLPRVDYKGVTFERIGCSFAWRDGLLYARDLRVSAGRGQLEGRLWIGPGDFRIEARNTIPPTKVLGIFDANTRAFIEKMEFKDLPEVSVSLAGTKLDFSGLRGGGHLKLGRTAMRGAWVDSAEANFEIGDRCVTYRDFLIKRDEGRGTGTFAYDIGRQEARLNGIRSTLVPHDVLMWIDPKIAEAVVPYRFRSPPTAVVEGLVHLKDATKNNLSVGIESEAGLEYDLLGKTLKLGRTSAQVNVVGTKVRANVKRSALMGGDLGLNATVSIDPKDPTLSVDAKVTRVNFAQLTKLYFNYDDSKGVMSGNYRFDAIQGKENLMKGAGSIRVEDGNVFAIPVLGPFSEILGSLLPGIGYQTARLATADFTVANEIINSRNLVIEGAGFSMFGAGDIHFMTSRLDMSMRVNAKGIPGIVFYPVSKLFEYVSTGTVADPGWRPKLIPRIEGDGGNSPPKGGRR